MDTWAQNYNANPQPFVWTRTADDIIAKVKLRTNRPNQNRDGPLAGASPAVAVAVEAVGVDADLSDAYRVSRRR